MLLEEGVDSFVEWINMVFLGLRAKKQKSVNGFKTGDLVRAVVTKGKKSGRYFGRVAVRFSGNFCIDTSTGKVDGISHRHCKNVQRLDGYSYSNQELNKRRGVSSPL